MTKLPGWVVVAFTSGCPFNGVNKYAGGLLAERLKERPRGLVSEILRHENQFSEWQPMQQELELRVYRQRRLCHTMPLTNDIQIGRQRPGEPSPFHLNAESGRLIVAPIDEKLVSREHLQLSLPTSRVTESPKADGAGESPRVVVRNLSRKRSVLIDRHGKLEPEAQVELETPLLISFEDFAIRVESASTGVWEVRSLEHRTMAPGSAPAQELTMLAQQTMLHASADALHDPQKLVHWLTEMMSVLQSAAGASDFLAQAVDAVDRIVGLDAIVALRLNNAEWQIEETRYRSTDKVGSDIRSPSRTILREIESKKSTVFQIPAGSVGTASLQGVKALVASPILDPTGEVIGAIYGARYSGTATQLPQISKLEAMMVEVIACSAAAGIAREKQQQKAIEARVQFEQFFTPQLARELESNPDLLAGQDAMISVLFCDIVGFSSVSNRVGSRMTMEWICSVMDFLSDAVLKHDGVVVDYIGDELMAMWGAPKTQNDHAVKACLAAMDLMETKAAIDHQWLDRVGQPIDFRIGICSGIASVGNTGSNRRLKYGPLGNTVNLASRLQSAAKQFGVRQVVSAGTAAGLHPGCGVQCRPLGTAQFVNIPAPIEVFEIGPESDVVFGQLAGGFAKLTHSLSAADWKSAQSQLQTLVSSFPDDQPSHHLLQRLQSERIDANCIWPFETK